MEVINVESRPKNITVVLNTHAVVLPSPETTGLAIKEAAIAQGVKIEVFFKLFLIRGHTQIPVTNDEHLKVHEHEEFRAVAPDDNS